jgi:hypothetical protein
MNMFTRLSLVLASLSMPVLAIAAQPASVRGITATLENGQVRIMWQQVTAPDIAGYRIYYSHQSILGNNGLFDDYESADRTVNAHVLGVVPESNELYVSVLAVNTQGEESPYFMEEAHVTLRGGAASAVSSARSIASSAPAAVSSAAQQRPAELLLRSTEAMSVTGVLLTFSHPVFIPQDFMQQAVRIQTNSGVALAVKRLEIKSNTLVVHTEPQKAGTVYRLTLGAAVTGIGANGQIIGLQDATPVLFSAFVQQGTVMSSAASSIVTSATSSVMTIVKDDVTQFRLRAQPDSANTYGIEATWQPPMGPGLTGYMVEQTTDGGNTYGAPRSISAQASTIKIAGVPPGSFGMKITAVYPNGMSAGVSQVIDLPRGSGNPLPGSVTPPPTVTTPPVMPNSGPALWAIVALAGAGIGAWQMRTRIRVQE